MLTQQTASESKQRSAERAATPKAERAHALSPGEQRREHFLGLQRTVGNQAVLRMLSDAAPAVQTKLVQRKCAACEDEKNAPRRIQTKLAIGSVGDPYELEADTVAERVMRQPAHGGDHQPAVTFESAGMRGGIVNVAPGSAPRISPLSAGSLSSVESSPATDHVERRAPQLEGSGSPLPERTRQTMESRFGWDFSHVRVHRDRESARMNESLSSLAFTHGRSIFFGSGAFQPGTHEGDRLIAHELTHVVQQSGGSSARPAAIQRYEEFRIRGTPFHKEIEKRLRDKNAELITEVKVPGGTTDKKELDAVGKPDLYMGVPSGTMPGVKGEYAKDDPDKRKLVYRNLGQGAADSASATSSSPKVVGGAFTGNFPNILVGDLKPLGVEKFLAGKLHLGPKLGEGMAQIGNYKQGYAEFVDQAIKDGKTSKPASGQNLTNLQIPTGLDYRNFNTEANAATPGEGAVVAGSAKVRYWIMPVPEWGLYAYFTLPHPFNAGKLKQAVDKVFEELRKFTATLRTNKKKVDPNIALPKRKPGAAGPAPAIQRKEAEKTDWGALAQNWEKQREGWDDTYAKPFLGKEGSQLGEKVAIDHVLGDRGPFKAASAPQVKEFRSVELWSGLSGRALVQGRRFLGSAFDKIIEFYEYVKTKFSGFHQKMQSTKSGGSGWKAKVITVVVEALKIGFRELLTAIYRIFTACINGIIDKAIDSFTDKIEEPIAQQLKTLHELFEKFRDEVKAEFEARFGSWDKLIEDLQDGATIVKTIMTMVDVIRVIIQIISCLSPPAAGCLWGIAANLAGEAALELGIPLILNASDFREQVVQPIIQDLLKDYAGEEIQSLIDSALGVVGLKEYAHDIAPCQVKGAAKPVKDLIPPVSGGLSGAALIAHRDRWQAEHRTELAAQIAPNFTTRAGSTASQADIIDLFGLIERRKPSPDELHLAFDQARDPSGKFQLEKLRQGLSGAPPGLYDQPPSVSKTVPSKSPGITFGPGSTLPPGADKPSGFGGVTIPLP